MDLRMIPVFLANVTNFLLAAFTLSSHTHICTYMYNTPELGTKRIWTCIKYTGLYESYELCFIFLSHKLFPLYTENLPLSSFYEQRRFKHFEIRWKSIQTSTQFACVVRTSYSTWRIEKFRKSLEKAQFFFHSESKSRLQSRVWRRQSSICQSARSCYRENFSYILRRVVVFARLYISRPTNVKVSMKENNGVNIFRIREAVQKCCWNVGRNCNAISIWRVANFGRCMFYPFFFRSRSQPM